MSNVKFKKLNDLARIPHQADSGSAGWDLYAASSYDIEIPPHKTVMIGTGLAIAFPENTFGAIFARSGIAIKRGLRPGNCVGIVDASFRNEVMVGLHNDTDEPQIIEAGERIAQLVCLPYISMNFEEVSELDETDRKGGFGSTGRK